jgi:hypothetical protein
LLAADFSNTHELTIPVTINVRGMESVFRWDWTEASKGPSSIIGHKLSNVGSKPVTVTGMAVGLWWGCDANHSNLTSIIVDDATVFSGSLDANELADVADFSIPVLTTVEDNELRFNGTINDQNEAFQVQVNFSDNTSYLSAVFGSGCAPDMTPPATVTDLAAVPGSEPKSVLLRFTFSGDDNFSGLASSAVFKYRKNLAIDSNNWSESSSEPYTGSFLEGGTQGTFLVTDYRIGVPFNFAVKFLDENNNSGNISNSPVSKPWNEFNYVLDDFNFAGFAPTDYRVEGEPVNDNDINKFVIHALQPDASSQRQISMRVIEDDNADNVWLNVLDFNDTHLTRIRIWYPAGGLSGVPGTAPQYDGTVAEDFSNDIDLLDPGLIPSQYRYNGQIIQMGSDNSFFLDILDGFTDMNLAFDISWTGESFEDGVGFGKT